MYLSGEDQILFGRNFCFCLLGFRNNFFFCPNGAKAAASCEFFISKVIECEMNK